MLGVKRLTSSATKAADHIIPLSNSKGSLHSLAQKNLLSGSKTLPESHTLDTPSYVAATKSSHSKPSFVLPRNTFGRTSSPLNTAPFGASNFQSSRTTLLQENKPSVAKARYFTTTTGQRVLLVAFKSSPSTTLSAAPTAQGYFGRAFSSESNNSGGNEDGSNNNGNNSSEAEVKPEEVKEEQKEETKSDDNQLIVVGDTETALKNQKTSPVPDRVLVIPLFRRPYFPAIMAPIQINDPEFVETIVRWRQKSAYVGLFLSKEQDEKVKITGVQQLYQTGVLASITSITSVKGGTQVLFSGYFRVAIDKVLSESASRIIASVRKVEDEPIDKNNKEVKAYHSAIISTIRDILRLTGPIHREQLLQYIQNADASQPGEVADITACFCNSTDGTQLQEVIEAANIEERQKKVLAIVKAELDAVMTQQRINKSIEDSANQSHRRHWLQEQYKQIRKELGLDKDERGALIEEYNNRIKKLTIPESPLKVINDELHKLSSLEPISSEYNVTRNYLDWLTQLPWGIYSKESLNVRNAQKILDEDHYGLKDIKERILEFIAVGKLKAGIQGKILCFAGPPGVGKTSIGKSIARALNREFYRFSVGGMSDVAEIKGHRRTYVGAMPGKIIQCLKTTKTSNPVVLIDEIDKLGRGYQGDPASALLEVLDPEQNKNFLDHYLDVPFDISKVLFLCTANVKDTIPGPLLDRMEVINLSGYVAEEKIAIAKQYLIPNALKEAGLPPKQLKISDDAISVLIKSYCRESGVRNLQKHVEKIMRKLALKFVKNSTTSLAVTPETLPSLVGKPVFNSDRYYDSAPAGVVMGLAWTAMGGATLYVESIVDKLVNKAEFKCTGQLGDVMKESTEIAYTYAKSFLASIDSGNKFFETASIHLHVPEGATPKDGPSAGITMVTSLMSLATGKKVKANLAMTGELTLTGKVLPIGGVKEKTIAARRSSVTHIIFPKDNEKDYAELPAYITKGLVAYFADYYADVYKIAFEVPMNSEEKRALRSGRKEGKTSKSPKRAASSSPSRSKKVPAKGPKSRSKSPVKKFPAKKAPKIKTPTKKTPKQQPTKQEDKIKKDRKKEKKKETEIREPEKPEPMEASTLD